ncbi:MAG TPA: DUF4126 domain-containing protein [Jiangellales bacterium]|nr:DUF4126 domain-containing protein [Jiangellales bacterium]
MDVLPLALAGGWASGISSYATVLVIGLAGRAGLADVPDGLERTDVLVVVGLLTAVEFFADKIAWLDSVWDSVHTVIRPLVAAGLGALLAGEAETLTQAATAALTAGVALLSHSAKAGLRLAVNTSPEPASNVAVSAAEDLSLVGVLLLATQAPWLAAAIAMLLLAIGLGLAWWLLSRVRRGWRRLWERLGVGPPAPPPVP